MRESGGCCCCPVRWDGQVFAGEELVIRDEAVIALPIIGDERLAFDADFVEEPLACGVITATKNPGDGSPSNRVIGSPKPQFLSLFFYKVPHLVESDGNHFSLGCWLGKLARFVADPVQNRHVADCRECARWSQS